MPFSISLDFVEIEMANAVSFGCVMCANIVRNKIFRFHNKRAEQKENRHSIWMMSIRFEAFHALMYIICFFFLFILFYHLQAK